MTNREDIAKAGSEKTRAAEQIPADAPIVPPRHWGQLIFAVVVVLIILAVAFTLARGRINWALVPEYIIDPVILQGVGGTLILTAAAMTLGVLVGVIIAVMRSSSNRVLSSIAAGYVWFFRGVPTLVQLLVWFNLALILPVVGIPGWFEVSTNQIMTVFLAALLGLGMSEGAYMAEIVRAGIEGVDRGQVEAAKSLGMSGAVTMRRIILPQAARLVIPPTGNQLIGMLKYTSLAFVIGYPELLSQARRIYQLNFDVMEVLFAATIWYLFLVSILSIGQRQLERYLARGQGLGERRTARKLELDEGSVR